MPAPLLKATALQKSYGEQTLFNIPCLEIYEGQRIGLVGENGCGKSTLQHFLKCLSSAGRFPASFLCP